MQKESRVVGVGSGYTWMSRCLRSFLGHHFAFAGGAIAAALKSALDRRDVTETAGRVDGEGNAVCSPGAHELD